VYKLKPFHQVTDRVELEMTSERKSELPMTGRLLPEPGSTLAILPFHDRRLSLLLP
jgi:hypothetical protein